MAKLIPVAPLAKLKRDKPVCVEHRGVPYCVVKVKEDKIKAFVSICTHKDLAMFPPDVKKKRLICPYHDAAFDASTGKLAKSSRKKAKRLPKVEIEVVDDMVHLEHRSSIPK